MYNLPDQAAQTLVTPAPAKASETLWPLLIPWNTFIQIHITFFLKSVFKIKEHMGAQTYTQTKHIHLITLKKQ